MAKRPGGQGSRAAKRARKAADKELKEHAIDDQDGDDFFVHSEQEQSGSESDGEEPEETQEEKRLRLARDYIKRLQEAASSEEDEGSGEEPDDGGEGGDADVLQRRLQNRAQLEAGHAFRRLASRLRAVDLAACPAAGGRLLGGHRAHRLPPTGVCLGRSDELAFSVGKDGAIFKWDVERGAGERWAQPEDVKAARDEADPATWVKRGPRQGGSRRGLLACAASADGRYLAVGGGARRVLLYDVRTGKHVVSFPGHRDAVSALAFRDGGAELYSGSFDRTVKVWNTELRAYMDTLFGPQAQITCVDVRRAERVLAGAMDHTVRLFKVPDETQLVFRSRSMTVEACRLLTSSEFVTGDQDGTLAVWSHLSKKPSLVVNDAHPRTLENGAAVGAGCVGEACASWISSIAVAKGSDLVASGAGNGAIRLWEARCGSKGGPIKSLRPVCALPARGFVNGLAVAESGRFLLAAVGQEPRLGRWARDAKARNGVFLHQLELA
ncbi:unnamed protein product [Pedinophyceae sp. YPF-701]|nr:unnamed protein product [Pedinophyceae sp. YPF-701]